MNIPDNTSGCPLFREAHEPLEEGKIDMARSGLALMFDGSNDVPAAPFCQRVSPQPVMTKEGWPQMFGYNNGSLLDC